MRYFVDDSRRLVRTEDSQAPDWPGHPAPWREVSDVEYDNFRAETKTMNPKTLKKLRSPK